MAIFSRTIPWSKGLVAEVYDPSLVSEEAFDVDFLEDDSLV